MKARHPYGFTLVELLIGMVAASILALTAGVLLVNSYRGWIRSLALADLEREGMVAVSAINYAVRGASTNGLACGVDTLTASGTVVNAFSVSSSNLIVNGDTLNPLVHGRLGKFVSSYSAVPVPSVQVTFELCDVQNNVKMTVSNMFIRLRN